MIHRDDDCISITEKTFDLSLDDTELDDSCIESDQQHQNPLSASQIPDKDYILPDRSIETLVFDDLRPMNEHRSNPLRNIENIQGGKDLKVEKPQFRPIAREGEDPKTSLVNENLIKSIRTLQKISVSEIKIPHNDSLDSLTKLNMELVENSELKMKFIEKNYKFLEKLYEDLTKDYELDKSKLVLQIQQMDQELKHWRQLGDVVQRKYSGDGGRSRSGSGSGTTGSMTPQELVPIVQNMNPVPTIDKNEIIKKQEKEIKDYKRFIKEMMER